MTEVVIAMRTERTGLDNDGQYWSEADKRLLIEYFKEGLGITEIALKLRRSEPAIVQQLVKEHMFEHETRSRRSRKPKNQCMCLGCFNYEECPRSPHNFSGATGCSPKGGVADHA